MPANQIQEERTIDPLMANLLGVVFGTAATLVLVGAYRLITGHVPVVGGDGFKGWGFVCSSIVVGIPIHEYIHALGFRWIGKVDRVDIRYGFNRRALAPFVHCGVPVPVRIYRWTAALPGVVLGVIPIAASIVLDSGQLFAIGYVLLLAALGDAMLIALLHDLPDRQLVQDHATKPGFCVLR